MRALKSTWILFVCLSIGGAARAGLSTGTWESTRTGGSTWAGSFDPGIWREYLFGGAAPSPGNEFEAISPNYRFDAVLDAITPLGTSGGLNGYSAVYRDGYADLFPGPWDSTAGAAYGVHMDAVTAEVWTDGSGVLLLSVRGTGLVSTAPWLRVTLEGTFDSRDSYSNLHADVFDYEGGSVPGYEGNIGWAKIAVTPVPIPGAVLLGVLGLSVAGWRLRRKTEF